MGHMMMLLLLAITPCGPVDDPNEWSFGTQRGGSVTPAQSECRLGGGKLSMLAFSRQIWQSWSKLTTLQAKSVVVGHTVRQQNKEILCGRR